MASKLLYQDEPATKFDANAPMKATPGVVASEAEPADEVAEVVTMTERAAIQLKMQAEKADKMGAAIRIGIRGGGCTGYSYHFDWDDKAATAKDFVFEYFGVRMYCDPKSMKLLKGTEIDFVTSMMGYGFKFNNPNAQGACGCGESVQF